MKYTQRVKRIADTLEKLGIAGLVLGIFQSDWFGLFIGVGAFTISYFLTPKE